MVWLHQSYEYLIKFKYTPSQRGAASHCTLVTSMLAKIFRRIKDRGRKKCQKRGEVVQAENH